MEFRAPAGVPGDDRAALLVLRDLATARVVRLGSGELPGAAQPGFDVRAAAHRVSPALALLPHEREDDGVATVVWERRRPLHPARLYEALEQLVSAAQRSRGRFWLPNRPATMLAWDAAGGSLAVQDCGPAP